MILLKEHFATEPGHSGLKAVLINATYITDNSYYMILKHCNNC